MTEPSADRIILETGQVLFIIETMMKEAGLKNSLKRPASLANLVLILLLICFSIYGAFIGADRAQLFFNSMPLTVYWLAFFFLLIWAIAIFRRLLCVRGLFLIHIGCILILAGGMWGSRAGLKIQNALFQTNVIRTGQMIIYEGMTDSAVETENEGTKTLPFAIKLVDFKIEYYQPGELIIKTLDGTGFKIPAEPGQKFVLDPNLGSVEIVRRFENFKLILEEGKRIAIDDPNGQPNPALELLLKNPDGSEKTKYVFERFPGHARRDDNLQFSYRRSIKDFLSDVEVIQNNNVAARKSIEVNKPLRFAGYHFYQQGYDDVAGKYTVLRVTNDTGLGVVYLGYILLCSGVFWHLWFRHIFCDREIED